MRILVGLALLLSSCGPLSQREVLCSQTDRCAPDVVMADGGLTSGCRSGAGTPLGGAVWACPGTFGGAGALASQLCSPGYAPCTSAGAANLATCGALSGF